MKKLFFVFPLLLLLLCGCGDKQDDTEGYHAYYINKEGTKIVETDCDLTAKEEEKIEKELFETLTTAPDSIEYTNAIPSDVNVTGYNMSETQLIVNFDNSYYSMDAMTEVLCRAAVVRTMMQAPGVSCVSFYVDGAPLTDENGTVVGVMTEESFVENPGEQINAIQETSVTLYFSNAEGNRLIKETQTVHYSSNISVEKLIMERLLEGPKSKNARATIPTGTKLVSVSTVDGICYVNFDEGFLNQNYEIQEAIVMYSIIDSLAELPTVNKVQIAVNGDTSGKYRDEFSFGTLYDRNLDYIEVNNKEEEEETSE